ncbi:uroporphyrinogen-III C-methyltransferase [Pseudokineococcus sp. 1T1Z-3]|uniref:uroporphyrinogen-III C-methyltransferase n=1 Tax=Pseudokineococcus sp. 1T1Z-3 TaxID=3132745 RepID=UPI0030A9BE82
MTDLLPLSLRVEGRRVLVVGGGAVASRSVPGLLAAGADVLVVAPEPSPPLVALADAGSVRLERRPFVAADLDEVWLAVTATGVAAVDAAVSAEAERRRVWCVDRGDAARASAWTPGVARVDDVTVAVSAGRDPRRAGRLRDGVAAALQSGDLPLRRARPRAAGRVALVGGGPADPGLLTARGRRLLAEADVVVTDRLGPRGVLAELDEEVLVVDVGKTPGNHPVPQEKINDLLVEHGLAGRLVVRLKGGDPYVFGRGGEELAACRAAGLDVEVVPGVTSAVSVPAAVGIPVTHRGVSRGFTVLTGHEDLVATPSALAGVPVEAHTVVLLMGVSALATSAAALVASGRPPSTPVAVVEDGYGPRQRATFGTLADVAGRAEAAGVRPPAVVVVGDVVTLAPGWPAAATDGTGAGAGPPRHRTTAYPA